MPCIALYCPPVLRDACAPPVRRRRSNPPAPTLTPAVLCSAVQCSPVQSSLRYYAVPFPGLSLRNQQRSAAQRSFNHHGHHRLPPPPPPPPTHAHAKPLSSSSRHGWNHIGTVTAVARPRQTLLTTTAPHRTAPHRAASHFVPHHCPFPIFPVPHIPPANGWQRATSTHPFLCTYLDISVNSTRPSERAMP
ncbi:hypothetical protein DM02DRAFT_3119 [Periconia macrospinosa]|uniref:Uncharacterized protein n=1 Tax=Periconia macrospinosa TaxID=97972 RepID=A0A2V1EG17_9PLEO|nr:hypothetical protein DM02DRAFT_3119 [Periconia macrospinosa]